MPALGTFSSRGGGLIIPKYRPQLGTKAPTLGAGGATWTPSGWTSLQNLSVDDASIGVGLGFNFLFNNTTYTTIYVGSNTYITFGAGASDYSGLSGSVPAQPKLHLGAADNSYQRVASRGASDATWQRIRYEGTAATSGTLGSPNIVYEATFFKPEATGGLSMVEILFGSHSRTGGAAGIASSSAYINTFTPSANQSYIFIATNAAATTWSILSGYYMAGTNY